LKKIIFSLLVVCLVISLSDQASASGKGMRYDDRRIVYMTFDDGPRPETLLLLDVLKKHRVKATFFILGKQIKGNEAILNRIVADGHTLGLHSMTHDKKLLYKSPNTVVHEMKQVQQLIFKTTGVETNVMRVPYGSVPHMTPRHLQAVEKEGLLMWDWNVDTLDWKRKTEPRKLQYETIRHVRNNRANNIASVVLMHDQSISPASLDYILRHLIRDGMTFRTITDETVPYHFHKKWKAKR